MTKYLLLSLSLCYLSAACYVQAQTPEVDAWKTAKAAETAARAVTSQAAIDAQTADATRQLEIQAGITQMITRLDSVEASQASILAALKALQAQPSVTAQQVLDVLIAQLQKP
jgi:hypothetical protein